MTGRRPSFIRDYRAAPVLADDTPRRTSATFEDRARERAADAAFLEGNPQGSDYGRGSDDGDS